MFLRFFFLLAALMLPLAAAAEQPLAEGPLFTFEGSTLVCCENAEAPVTVPSVTPEGLPVTAIGAEAFLECSAPSITLPDTVETIADGAFKSCSYLEAIILPESCTAFFISGGALFSAADARLIWYPVTAEDEEYTIPAGTLRIGDGAFYGCANLTRVNLPEGLESIGSEAFALCDSLKVISLPKSIQEIAADAFDGDDNLTLAAYGGTPGAGFAIGSGLTYILAD